MRNLNLIIDRKANINIEEILKLYGDSTLQDLHNDIVAIGSWPTPEKPNLRNRSVAIDTVPLPERPSALLKIINSNSTVWKSRKLNTLIRLGNTNDVTPRPGFWSKLFGWFRR